MISLLFRIGMLAPLVAAVAPADARRRTYCPTWDLTPSGTSSARHRSNYCSTCERTPSRRIRSSSSAAAPIPRRTCSGKAGKRRRPRIEWNRLPARRRVAEASRRRPGAITCQFLLQEKYCFIMLKYRRHVSFMSSPEPSCSSDRKPVKPTVFTASAMALKSITPCPMATYSRIAALTSRT